MRDKEKKVYGIPRIGGKYALIQMIVPMLEYIAKEKNCNLFADVCMGGQKIIGNIDHNLFPDGVFGNDWESGLWSLASVLKTREGLNSLVENMNGVLAKIEAKDFTAKDFFEYAKKFLDEYTDERASARVEKDRKNPKEMEAALCMLYTTYAPTYSNATCFHLPTFKRNFIEARVHESFGNYPDKYQHITFTNEDFMTLLEAFGGREDVLIYLDPPYTEEAMTSTGHYRKNADDEAQHKMVDLLLSDRFKAKVLLSGWENEIYKRLEDASYTKYYIANVYVSTSNRAGIGTRAKKEYIWSNVEIPHIADGIELIPSSSKLEKEYEEIEAGIIDKRLKIVKQKRLVRYLDVQEQELANLEKTEADAAAIKKKEAKRKAEEKEEAKEAKKKAEAEANVAEEIKQKSEK